MNELSCGVARDLLPLYADQLAGEESRALVEAHLQACEACQAALASMQATPEPPLNAEDSLRKLNSRLRRSKRIRLALFALLAFWLVAGLALTLPGYIKSRPSVVHGYYFYEAMKDHTNPVLLTTTRRSRTLYVLEKPVTVPISGGTLTLQSAYYDWRGLVVEGVLDYDDDEQAQALWMKDNLLDLELKQKSRGKRFGGEHNGLPGHGMASTVRAVYKNFRFPGLPFTMRYGDAQVTLRLTRVKGERWLEDMGFTAWHGDISLTAIPLNFDGKLGLYLVFDHGDSWSTSSYYHDKLWLEGPGGLRVEQDTVGNAHRFDVPFEDASQYTLHLEANITMFADMQQTIAVFDIPLR